MFSCMKMKSVRFASESGLGVPIQAIKMDAVVDLKFREWIKEKFGKIVEISSHIFWFP